MLLTALAQRKNPKWSPMKPPKVELLQAGGKLPPFHRFSHRAMATVFEIFIVADDFAYAEQAAHAAFTELYFIEMELSRYVPGSDISRLNTLPPNKILQIGHDAFECLNVCKALHVHTGGAFDVSVGAVLDCWRQASKKGRLPAAEALAAAKKRCGLERLDVDEQTHTVCVQGDDSLLIDLGGFGKGYAVDRLAELLEEWSIEHALIHGGSSSILATGELIAGTGWPISLSQPGEQQMLLATAHLRNRAISGSGVQKGQHIIDPRTGEPATAQQAAWAVTPNAALRDALSTAFMIMSPPEIEAFCRAHSEVQALLILGEHQQPDRSIRVLHFGDWYNLSIRTEP